MATRKHRDYDNDYPSVTTILSVLRKIGLEMWFKFNTIKFINDATAKGKLIGTQTHEAIEHYINTGEAKIETEWIAFQNEIANPVAMHVRKIGIGILVSVMAKWRYMNAIRLTKPASRCNDRLL